MASIRPILFVISAFALLVGCNRVDKPPAPFPYLEGCLFGYMRQDSSWVIEPRFHTAQYFSEGLAAVREEGTYGYIDESGSWIIQPRFDYAEPFEKYGLARAYVGDQVIVIDRKGSHVFKYEKPYKTLDIVCEGKSVIYTSRLNDTTYKNRYTLITSSGQEINVASNKSLRYIFGNIYTLTQQDLPEGSTRKKLHLDEDLNQIPSLVGASRIYDAGGGYGFAEWTDQNQINDTNKKIIRQAILNKAGDIIVEIDTNWINKFQSPPRFFEEIAVLRILEEEDSAELYSFILLRTDGSISPVADRYRYIMSFNNRAAVGWVSDTLGYLISPSGQRLPENTVTKVDYKTIHHGAYKPIERDTRRKFSSKNIALERERNEANCRNVDRRTISPYPIANVPKGNPQDIFKLRRTIWINSHKYDTIRYDSNGYFKINEKLLLDTGGVQVIQNQEAKLENSNTYFITNATSDTVMFSTLYGRLLCSLEAQDSEGVWKPIEIEARMMICGNSYGYALLPPDHAWEVEAPIFEGAVTTNMRLAVRSFSSKPYPWSFAMSLPINYNSKAFSEPFEGEINPGQLWR